MKKNSAMLTTVITKVAFLSLVLSVLVFSPFAFAAIAVNDGSLGDWGVTPGAFNSVNPDAQWAPSAGIQYIPEDQLPADGRLYPGWGGQDFDVEAIYFKREADIAYFAVVSGFPLATFHYGNQDYLPGDLAFDFGSNGSYEFGLATTAHSANGLSLAQGDLVKDATTKWSNPSFTASGPFQLTGGTYLGGISDGVKFGYSGTNTKYVGAHYFFEAGIPVSSFVGTDWTGGNPDFTVHWTMSCGNDALNLYVKAVHTPEPGTYLLLLMGLSGFALYRRSRLV